MEQSDWLTKLYCDHKQLLLLVAWNVVNRRDLAEDAVHAAIVKLAQLPAQPSNPKAFAIRTVRNIAIDASRSQSRHREESLCDHLLKTNEECDLELQSERISLLQNTILQMETEDREAIQLHLQAGLTFREIAEALDVPIQTIASRYRRAITKLKALVEVAHER